MCGQLYKVCDSEITKYLYYHRSYGELKFNDSIVTSTEIVNDSDLDNLNNTLHKDTAPALIWWLRTKVHVRNGFAR